MQKKKPGFFLLVWGDSGPYGIGPKDGVAPSIPVRKKGKSGRKKALTS